MSNELYDKWVKESQDEIDKVEKEVAVRGVIEGNQPVTTHFKVDSVGAISAHVFSENGYTSAELRYNHDTSQCPGAYILNFAYPDMSKVQTAYASLTGVDSESVKINDPDFIKWMEETSGSDQWWDQTHASWTHSSSFHAGIGYETKHDALMALATGDVFSTMKFDNLHGVKPVATEASTPTE